jgi:hypothetical protein
MQLHQSEVIGSASMPAAEVAFGSDDRHDKERINLVRLSHCVNDLGVLGCSLFPDVRR